MNTYFAPCTRRGTEVPAGEGVLSRTRWGAWNVTHPDATCEAVELIKLHESSIYGRRRNGWDLGETYRDTARSRSSRPGPWLADQGRCRRALAETAVADCDAALWGHRSCWSSQATKVSSRNCPPMDRGSWGS